LFWAHIASAFAANGYKIALAACSLDEGARASNKLNIIADLADPHSVSAIFMKVKERLGLPSVVVYNCKIAAKSLSL
jgi:NAD(P)-dependent dehydrogenase (short-subunit alcohol dehydrogenase family)